jgi:endonuclease V-like protein UPF0215 family
MIVFSQKEFDGVHIYSIGVGTRWGLLSMMMFVDISVDGLDVQCPVQNCVEEIVDDKKWYDG